MSENVERPTNGRTEGVRSEGLAARNPRPASGEGAERVLHIEHLTMRFGGVVAVNDLSMDINKGEIVALIGPNGAGKTTAFNAVTGVYEPTNGAVYFHDKLLVTNYPRGKMKKLYAGENRGKYTKAVAHTPDYITKLGIARTFQNIRLFKSMTVFDNVLTAMHLRKTAGLFTAIFRANRKEEQKMRADADELLRIVDLYDVRDELASASWRSPGPWPRSRPCCCSTSPPPA